MSWKAKVEVYNAVVVPMMTYIWVRIMGIEGKGKGQAAGNRDECIEEGSRSD